MEDSPEQVVVVHQHSEVLAHSQESGLGDLHRMADVDTAPAGFAAGIVRSLHQGQDRLHLLVVVHLKLSLHLLQNHKLDLRMRASSDPQQLGLAGLAQGMCVLHNPVVHPCIVLASTDLDLADRWWSTELEAKPYR